VHQNVITAVDITNAKNGRRKGEKEDKNLSWHLFMLFTLMATVQQGRVGRNSTWHERSQRKRNRDGLQATEMHFRPGRGRGDVTL